ncbi:MAG: carbohydrate ABC transporter permease [Chloroflexi bacterium]|nr:carbohydrate ABC transporter permease [Chloroflexota bacterium]
MTVTKTTATTAARFRAERRPAGHYIGLIFRYLVLAGIGLAFLTPFILAFFGSFKTNREILSYPPRLFPEVWHFDNWTRVFQSGSTACEGLLGEYCFPYWLWNSVWLAVVRVLLRTTLAVFAGYAFARMRFPGKDVIFALMLGTMMIPGAVTLIPGYVLIVKYLGWGNSYWALIVPGAVEVFGIFLMTQFLKAVPIELEEAAFIDGASRFTIIKDVVVPLAKPALLTLAILAFQASWNEFLGPLLYLNTQPKFTLTVGMQFFRQQFREDWNLILVGSMFNAIPVLVIFFFFQRYFIEGVSYAGLKG